MYLADLLRSARQQLWPSPRTCPFGAGVQVLGIMQSWRIKLGEKYTLAENFSGVQPLPIGFQNLCSEHSAIAPIALLEFAARPIGCLRLLQMRPR